MSVSGGRDGGGEGDREKGTRPRHWRGMGDREGGALREHAQWLDAGRGGEAGGDAGRQRVEVEARGSSGKGPDSQDLQRKGRRRLPGRMRQA